jgi:hypothetical protein
MRARFPYSTARELLERPPTRSVHPVHVYHERIEDYHMAVASRARDAVTAPRTESEDDDPEHEASRLQSALDRIAEDLTGATRGLEQLLDSLPPEVRRKNLHAIAMLSRAHDDCCQELAEAGDALRTGAGVHVRIRLAGLFSAVGRAEQAHYYWRTARPPAS